MSKEREALNAIIARIEGIYDNPSLMRFGSLQPDTLADVLTIAKAAIEPKFKVGDKVIVEDYPQLLTILEVDYYDGEHIYKAAEGEYGIWYGSDELTKATE